MSTGEHQRATAWAAMHYQIQDWKPSLLEFLWIGWPDLCDDDERQPDRNEEEREELAARNSQNQAGIRFAKILESDPEHRVEHKEHAGQHTIGLPHPRAHKQHNRE